MLEKTLIDNKPCLDKLYHRAMHCANGEHSLYCDFELMLSG